MTLVSCSIEHLPRTFDSMRWKSVFSYNLYIFLVSLFNRLPICDLYKIKGNDRYAQIARTTNITLPGD